MTEIHKSFPKIKFKIGAKAQFDTAFWSMAG